MALSYLMIEGRNNPSKVGLIHVCSFVLLLLSGERDFSVQLNKSYNLRLPVDLPVFTGSYTDLLVLVFHKLVVNSSDRPESLYECFLTAIANVSPYCKSLSILASIKLLNLFELFSSPR